MALEPWIVVIAASGLLAYSWGRIGSLQALVGSGLASLLSLAANGLLSSLEPGYGSIAVALFVLSVASIFVAVVALAVSRIIQEKRVPPL